MLRRRALTVLASVALVTTVVTTVVLGVGCSPEAPSPVRDASESPGGDVDFPALAMDAKGAVWMATQAWTGKQDVLSVQRLEPGPDAPIVVREGEGRLLGTALAALDDEVVAAWVEETPDGWHLFTRSLEGAAGTPGPTLKIGGSAGVNVTDPALASGPEGDVLAVWREVSAQGLVIVMRYRFPDGTWDEPMIVSAATGSGWAPTVVAFSEWTWDRDGDDFAPPSFVIAWDAAIDGDFDVYIARVGFGVFHGIMRPDDPQRVTDTPRFEAHPSLAVDGNRLYLAYDVAPAGWGREGATNDPAQALHIERTIEVVCIEEGRVAPLAVQPADSIGAPLAGDVDQPRLAAGGTLFFRGLNLDGKVDDPGDPAFAAHPRNGRGPVGWRHAAWTEYRTHWDGTAWTTPEPLAGSRGRLDAPAAVVARPDGWTVWAVTGDGRINSHDKPPTPDAQGNWWAPIGWWEPVAGETPTRVTFGGRTEPVVGWPAPGVWRTLGEAPQRAARNGAASKGEGPNGAAPRTAPTRTLPDGRTLTLALGDLHRHTDISRCSMNWDGSLADAYRYAWDVGGLDFLAVTDHFEHMTAYDWHRSAALADAMDAPGRMVALRGYERAVVGSGHRNVIARGGGPPLVGYPDHHHPYRDDAYAESIDELWQRLQAGEALTIPHTPAGMLSGDNASLDWRDFDPAFDRVVEVFQGYRGSSEAHDAPRAMQGFKPWKFARPHLARDLHFGFVASSDHQSSFGAFAGVWVDELSRAGVFDALHGRLAFGSTVPASVWMEWGGHPMGTSAQAPPGPQPLEVTVDGFDRAVNLVRLIVDGVEDTVWISGSSRPGGSTRIVAPFVVDVPAHGSRFAYARIEFADGELAWTSPVRLGDGADGSDGLTGAEALERHGSPAPR